MNTQIRGAIMKRYKALIALIVSLVVVAGGVGLFLLRKRAPAPRPLEIELAQSLSRDFSKSLETLLAPYVEKHPNVKVHVRYEPYPGRGALAASDALVALRPIEEGAKDGAVPLFASDFMVLAYNRAMVDAAPRSWPELLARATSMKDQGKAAYGLALPEEPYSLMPFFSDVLFPTPGAETDEKAREAFSLLFDLRFSYGLTPHMCTSDCAVKLFTEGRAPFALVGEWRLGELQKGLGAKLGLAAVPALPVTGAKVRSVKREVGLVRAGDANAHDGKAADDLVSYLKTDCRAKILEVLGKVPVPLEAPKDRTSQAAQDEAALVAILGAESVQAPEADVRAAMEKLTPIWEQFSEGKIGPNEASQLLVAKAARAD
jgi:ABC-type glycerol-3-phosphate transport system substrate-binding protein